MEGIVTSVKHNLFPPEPDELGSITVTRYCDRNRNVVGWGAVVETGPNVIMEVTAENCEH